MWDFFLLDGEVALYKAALAILRLGEDALLQRNSLEDLRPALIKVPTVRDIDVFAAALRKITIPARIEAEIAQIEQDCIPGGQLSSDPVRRSSASTFGWLFRIMS